MVEVTKNDLLFFENEILQDLKSSENKINQKINDLKEELNKQSSVMDVKLNTYSNKLSLLTTEISEISTKKTSESYDNQIKSMTKKIELLDSNLIEKLSAQSRKIEEISTKFEKMFNDNLSIPYLIGKNCHFSSIKSYLEYINKKFKEIDNLNVKQNTLIKNLEEKIFSKINIHKSNYELYKNQFQDFCNNLFSEYDNKNEIRYKEIEEKIQKLKIENGKFSYDLLQRTKNFDNESIKLEEFKKNILGKLEEELKNYKKKIKNIEKNVIGGNNKKINNENLLKIKEIDKYCCTLNETNNCLQEDFSILNNDKKRDNNQNGTIINDNQKEGNFWVSDSLLQLKSFSPKNQKAKSSKINRLKINFINKAKNNNETFKKENNVKNRENEFKNVFKEQKINEKNSTTENKFTNQNKKELLNLTNIKPNNTQKNFHKAVLNFSPVKTCYKKLYNDDELFNENQNIQTINKISNNLAIHPINFSENNVIFNSKIFYEKTNKRRKFYSDNLLKSFFIISPSNKSKKEYNKDRSEYIHITLSQKIRDINYKLNEFKVMVEENFARINNKINKISENKTKKNFISDARLMTISNNLEYSNKFNNFNKTNNNWKMIKIFDCTERNYNKDNEEKDDSKIIKSNNIKHMDKYTNVSKSHYKIKNTENTLNSIESYLIKKFKKTK